jgi:hypothetical protein
LPGATQLRLGRLLIAGLLLRLVVRRVRSPAGKASVAHGCLEVCRAAAHAGSGDDDSDFLALALAGALDLVELDAPHAASADFQNVMRFQTSRARLTSPPQ